MKVPPFIPASGRYVPYGTASGIRFAGTRFQGKDRFEPEQAGLDKQRRNFLAWAEEKWRLLPEEQRPLHHLPAVEKTGPVSPTRRKENAETIRLFSRTFPTFLWTGIECSNPTNRKGERWDQLEMAGVYDARQRRQQIGIAKSLGIENVRLGIPNHKVDSQKNWHSFMSILKDFKAAGMKVSLDLLHFGLPDRFDNPLKPEESQFLNPKWPEYFIKSALAGLKRFGDQVDAVTLINEPLVTNNFSGTHWNEHMPGDPGHPRFKRYFIERALLIAEAAVKGRYRIEKQYVNGDPAKRKVFVHNESCEYRADEPEFNQHMRFLTSDLILGQDWLMREDWRESDMVRWMLANTAPPVLHEGDDRFVQVNRERLLQRLAAIRDMHVKFQEEFGKTMRADTVFGVDYYITCERGPGVTCDTARYAGEVKSGTRKGLYGITMDYWNRYQLPILHTETNMANRHSSRWGLQQLFELAQLERSGVPVLGFNWYSLMDQYGWDKGLDASPAEASRNHIGLVSLRDFDLRGFAREILPDLRHGLEYRVYPEKK